MMKYGRFFLMIATSTVIMFGLMYLNTYLFSHVLWSETRAWMALLMGAAMAIIMLAFMLSMYKNRALNLAIFAGSALVFGLSLWLVRSQVTVNDTDYMSAMIPHHSIAIMTSSRAGIEDGRVRKLADEIIYAQDKEIAEMKYLLASINEDGVQSGEPQPSAQVVNSLEAALTTPDIPVLDPQFFHDEEIQSAMPQGAACAFIYTEDSRPVLLMGSGDAGQRSGALKISGDIVPVSETSPWSFAADRLTLQITDLNDGAPSVQAGSRQEANLVMSIGEEATVGYRGYVSCS